jgi:GNAT superfamily N-acetyltransferase
MITIKQLTQADMQQAIELKVFCWTEELADKAENNLIVSAELKDWLDWMNKGEENEDVRLLIGAFEEEQMLGVAFASFAESSDIPEKGIELNGLWVYPDQRGRGISLMLVLNILDFYMSRGMEEIVIYNHTYSPSNKFYHKFGAQVLRQDQQMNGKLLVDVFVANMMDMKNKMEKSQKEKRSLV